MYKLTEIEQQRLLDGIQAAYAIPFIHDITDFIWEAVFSYAKGIPIIDPLENTRKKLLYDVVDKPSSIGWSAKAIQKSLNLPTVFEIVIQRADIFKKAIDLGFEPLNIDSSPQILGRALLKHWYRKVQKDADIQGVEEKRICILLKSHNRTKYIYIEENLTIYRDEELRWQWTDETRTGLQGIRKQDDFVAFRWYPNQKQLFERFHLAENTFTFELKPQRLPSEEIVHLLLGQLGNQ